MAHDDANDKKSNLGFYFYRPGLLNKWFFVSCLLMGGGYVGTVWQDYNRPWKDYQREFMDLEYRTAQLRRDEVWADLGGASLDDALANLQDQLDEHRATLSVDHQVRPGLVQAVADAQFHFNLVNAEMKAAKAKFEAERFHYEELAHEHGDDLWEPKDPVVQEALVHYRELKEAYEELERQNKSAEAALKRAQADLDRNDHQVNVLQGEIDDLEREMGRFERRMASVDSDRPFTKFRNSIFVDFMAPSITVNKIVVPEIHDDLNFLSVRKVDMCTTCHLATDRYQDYPHGAPMFRGEDPRYGNQVVWPVFQAHPHPELFATSLSPHGQERFGCSGCHHGGNQRLNFNAAAHMPNDEEQKRLWQERHDWEEVHYWDKPQYPTRFLEASCYKCHQDQVHIPGADQWNRGRDLAEDYGCYGCHKLAPFEGHRKAGPPLYHMTEKFQGIEWALKWVSEPRAFRDSTRMPQFFHLENRVDPTNPDPADQERMQAEITALVTYLYNLTQPVALDAYPGNGDAARGKALFGEDGGVGCMACHDIDDFQSGDLEDRHGPDLSGVGSKLQPDWLYTWLRNPQSIWADTNMPDLRLTEQEAADLVAYLMTKRNQEFEERTFQRPEGDAVYAQIVREKLTEQMTLERANDQIGRMSSLDLRLRAGEFLLNHYGCFGCHDVAGFEDAKQIGTELNGWGSKHADRLDFGVYYMDYKRNHKFNRIVWLEQKLKNTRFWDRGKDKAPFENLKMPQFRFPQDPDDLQAVMTFVLSLVKDPLEESIQKHLSPAETAVERGRNLLNQKNCLGCHMLYEKGGELRTVLLANAPGATEAARREAARAWYPPVIDGQGAKTQHDWLFDFLTDPSMGAGDGSKNHLRPWLKARMPTFHFSQDDLNDLIAYFAHEENWNTATDPQFFEEVEQDLRDTFPGYTDRDLRLMSAEERGDKVALFQALAARNYKTLGGEYLHQTDYPYLSQVERELSGDVHAMSADFFKALECVECHRPGGQPPPGKKPSDMAPELKYAKERLQPDYVRRWLGGPSRYQPGTAMPSFWERDATTGERPSHPASPVDDANKELDLVRDYIFSQRFEQDLEGMLEPGQD